MADSPKVRTRLPTWARALSACLIWFGLVGGLLWAMYLATLPDLPAITRIEAAASHETAGPEVPVDAPWQMFDLPLRTCKVRCETPFTVYRHTFRMSAQPASDWALYLPFFDANIAVYLDGVKIDERGRMHPPVDVYRYHSRLVLLPAARLTAGEHSLLLQLVSERRHSGGLSPFYLAPAEQLAGPQRWRMRLTEEIVAGVGWLQAGSLLVALAIFLRGRREPMMGWYLIASVFWLVFIGLHASPSVLPGGSLRMTAIFVSIAGVLAFTPLFMVGILQPPSRWLRLSLVTLFLVSAFMCVAAAYLLPLDPYWQAQVPNWSLKLCGYLLVPLMFVLLIKIVLARGDSWTSSWILAFAAMPGVFGVVDAVRGTWFLPVETALMPISGLGVSLALWLELGRRMLENHQRMSRHTAELEATVRAREAALHQSYEQIRSADRERALADERQRMLRDMHDGVGGQLASLVHLADNPETSREQVVAGLREGLADLRLVLDSLAQDEDDPLLALGRLRHRIEPTLEAAGMKLVWEVDPNLELPAWSPESVLHIYRLLQESTHNAIRHARARTLTIRVRPLGAQLEFSVTDDGCGFDPLAGSGQSFGLLSLQARAARLGGQLQVISTVGGGTRVQLHLPLSSAVAV